MNPIDIATHSTIRLECSSADRSVQSVGTGFHYNFEYTSTEKNTTDLVPTIITNKHVVKNMDTLNVQLTLIPKGIEPPKGRSVEGEIHFHVRISNLQKIVLQHPDPEVDIAAIFFVPIAEQAPKHMDIRYTAINERLHLSYSEELYTRSVEPILMVGYPNGLWDEINNRPISRRGVTASHPLERWNGKRCFMIDAACYRGSSGSPVFLFEDGMFRSHADSYSPGTRVKFLGVLYAGPTVSQQGILEQIDIPTSVETIPVVEGMLNLGFVSHADTIKDLKPIIENLLMKNS